MVDQVVEIGVVVETNTAMGLVLLLPIELTVAVLNPVYQAPAYVEFYVSGGQPEVDAIISIDGTDLMTVPLDTDGGLSMASAPLSATLGAAGTHDLTVTQETVAGTAIGTATFEVLVDPISLPAEPASDVSPTLPMGAVVVGRPVQRWVLQDPYADGIGSYVLPQNPRTMTSPSFSRTLTSRRTILPTGRGGRFHVFESAGQPKEWSFTGICTSEEMHDQLLAFRNLNRRFWLIDHRNRAWKVVFTNVDLSPRLQTNYNGELSDWIEDYTVTAMILDQSPEEPT